jgi:hypothetical protein
MRATARENYVQEGSFFLRRNLAIKQGRLFEDARITDLPKGRTYSYVILDDGTKVFGDIRNGLEYGVKHIHLANGRAVVAAGELSVDASGAYSYNLLSGSYTMKMIKAEQTTSTKLKELIEKAFTQEAGPGTYTSKTILPAEDVSDRSMMYIRLNDPKFCKDNPGFCN